MNDETLKAYCEWCEEIEAGLRIVAKKHGCEFSGSDRAASRYIAIFKADAEGTLEANLDIRLSDHSCRYGGVNSSYLFGDWSATDLVADVEKDLIEELK